MPSEKNKQKAIDALEGMRLIVKREMLVRGEYVTDDIKNPKLAEEGALCQGRQYCAIGSLWIGGGVKLHLGEYLGWAGEYLGWAGEVAYFEAELPGVFESARPDFLRRRPGLKLAYESLNAAAADWIKKYDLDKVVNHPNKEEYKAEIEALFENGHKSRKEGANLGRPELLKLITAAKRKVNAA